jgi:uncharacterized membrane protein YvbJ
MKTGCVNCGAEVEDTETFCMECGRRLTRETPLQSPSSVPSRKENRTVQKLLSTIMILLGIGIIILSVYMAMITSYLDEPPDWTDLIWIVLGLALIFGGFVVYRSKTFH